MESLLTYGTSGLLVVLALVLLIGLIKAIRKFAPKSKISEAAIKLIEDLYKTIDFELERVIKENGPDSKDIALVVFLAVKAKYRDQLEEIVKAFSVNTILTEGIHHYFGDTMKKAPQDEDSIKSKAERIIFKLIEDKIELRFM